jgi:hypothetical protein
MKKSRSAQSPTDRREFLTKAGKLAVVAPPAMTMLLSTSLTSPAIAASGGHRYVFADPPPPDPPSKHGDHDGHGHNKSH